MSTDVHSATVQTYAINLRLRLLSHWCWTLSLLSILSDNAGIWWRRLFNWSNHCGRWETVWCCWKRWRHSNAVAVSFSEQIQKARNCLAAWWRTTAMTWKIVILVQVHRATIVAETWMHSRCIIQHSWSRWTDVIVTQSNFEVLYLVAFVWVYTINEMNTYWLRLIILINLMEWKFELQCSESKIFK